MRLHDGDEIARKEIYSQYIRFFYDADIKTYFILFQWNAGNVKSSLSEKKILFDPLDRIV